MKNRKRVFLVCPGLGHVRRGYESFTRECFDALRNDERIDLWLFKGAGVQADHERTLWCLHRTDWAARILGNFGGTTHDPYYVEQASFTLLLLWQIARKRPHVVFFSDPAIGHLLWRWRATSRGKFKLLLSNGGPTGPPSFPRIDHIHQVSPICFAESTAAGRSSATQTLIDYGFRVPKNFSPLTREERQFIRKRLNLATDRQVLLTVGTVNQSHKRMGYIIDEVATLPHPRPHLVILGQRDSETAALLERGYALLGAGGLTCRTVTQSAMHEYYECVDVFVLASLNEGFGRVLVEALSYGLPCFAHDGAIQRYVMGEHGIRGNFTRTGELARLIRTLFPVAAPLNIRDLQQSSEIANRYSWATLAPRYLEMIIRCASHEGSEVGTARTEIGTSVQIKTPRK